MVRPCVYLTSSARKAVLFVGSTHAGHISQALIDAAAGAKWNSVIWTHSACHVQFSDPKGFIPRQEESSLFEEQYGNA